MPNKDLTTFLDYKFNDPKLLDESLTHKSYMNENMGKTPYNNERFEFMGDAILEFVITDLLLKKFKESNEGTLSKYRADIVNKVRLAEIARKIGLGKLVKLGKGETSSSGSEKESILANALEAIFAAIYLDGGITKIYKIIEELFLPFFDSMVSESFSRDFKTRLQQYAQEHFKTKPVYRHLKEEGPDHEKIFEVEVSIKDELKASGEGNSKKNAEQKAAETLLKKILNLK